MGIYIPRRNITLFKSITQEFKKAIKKWHIIFNMQKSCRPVASYKGLHLDELGGMLPCNLISVEAI